MGMRTSLTYMLVGAGLGAGALATYHQMKNGNLENTLNKVRNQAQDKLENMM